MSCLMNIIRARRSVRAFDGRAVAPDLIAGVVEAARWAPSACNIQPWRFIAVTDPDLKKQFVRECLGGIVPNRWASTAGAFLIACAEKNFIAHRLAEPLRRVSYHQVDIGIAMEHAVLRAAEMGLGTCYIGWFKQGRVRNILKIPRKWKIVCILAIGYPVSGEETPKKVLHLREILFFNGPFPADEGLTMQSDDCQNNTASLDGGKRDEEDRSSYP